MPDVDDWEQLQSLFHQAESVPREELTSFLDHVCEDPGLRDRALTLILTARELPDEPPAAAAPLPAPARLGPYTILRTLGSGGLGTVYLGERTVAGAQQCAAIKVLGMHASGPSFTERFAREQHILASLDHPHITRLLDAGFSQDDKPYLAMEYVDGLHLSAFCDDRALPPAERLRLFLQVCDAVAYAHRNLVVHLDLKPSNILVSRADGQVKLLDFGTSKLVDPDQSFTTTIMATPGYASPEQLRNEPVTTACDIYSLGTILFELLTGRRPNQGRSVAMMIERSMRELPPELPTSAVTAEAAALRGMSVARLRGFLSGDLATIAVKCLSPRPAERYASVDALAEDVRRFLDERPILARPQTKFYQLGKFVRRNRNAVAAGALAALLLAGSLGYAAWRQHQALVAAQRAVQMQAFMYRLFRLANSNYLGKPTFTVPEFLQLGVKVLPDFVKNSADQRAAELSLAESMFDNEDMAHAMTVFDRVIAEAGASHDLAAKAEAETYAGYLHVVFGDTKPGQTLSEEGHVLAHRRGVPDSVRVLNDVLYVATHLYLGKRSEDDLKVIRSAVVESRRLRLPDREAGFILISSAEYLGLTGHLDEGESLLTEAIAIYDREPYALCDRAEIYVDLGYARGLRGDPQGSLQWLQRGYDAVKACRGPEDHRTLIAQTYIAGEMLKLGRAREEIPMLEASMPGWRKLYGTSPELYFGLMPLARAYVAAGDFEKGEETAQECVRVQMGKLAENSTRVALSYLVLAEAEAGLRRDREAREHAERANHGFEIAGTLSENEREHAAEAKMLKASLNSHGTALTAQSIEAIASAGIGLTPH